MKQVYINGNVITVDEGKKRCEAFAVKDGFFVHVGDNKSVMCACNGEKYSVVDLRGKTVIPGINDSHIHLLNYAYSLSKVNMEGLNSVERIVERGKEALFKYKIPKGDWLLGRGWNHYFFEEPRFLTRQDLDRISTEHPILFTRVCEHTVTVNTMALKILGIDDDTPDPEGGEIVRDEQGKAVGILRETARYLAYERLPLKSVEEIKELLVTAMDKVSAWGITSVQSDDFETFSDKDWRKVLKAYQELKEEGKMKVRLYEQCLLPSKERILDFINAGYYTGWGDDMLKIGPLKLLMDGSLGPHSALLSTPYSDEPDNCGIGVFTQEELNQLLLLGHKNHMQLACHGIGDRAIRMILDGYKKVQEYFSISDARMGIVHVQVGAPDIYERMKKQEIIGYLQPVFIQADMHCAEERLGKERLSYAYKFKKMRDMGIRSSLSSDAPVETPNPMDGIYVAATRMDYNQYPEGGWDPAERMEVEDIIKGYTLDSAYAQFEEDKKGSITEGKMADFLVLSEDITDIPLESIRNIKVLSTYVGGRKVFSAL